jgi:hypothetical protein
LAASAKQFATDNARAQAEPHGLVRAGNSIEWYKCNCGEQSNLIWTYKSNKSRILACCLDCARTAKHIVEEETRRIRCRDGWIYWKPQAGDRYYVTANGFRAQMVGRRELSAYVAEVAIALGGRVRS